MSLLDKKMEIKMIEELSMAKGISGFEDEVVKIIRNYSEGHGTMKEDSLRNLYVYRKGNTGNRPIVQLDSHSDEVGFMIQAIKSNGTLQIVPIGSWVPYNIPAHKVWVRNSDGEYISGIVGSKPPHYMSEADKKANLEMNHFFVDVGASSLDEAVNDYKLRIGEPVVPCADFEYNDKQGIIMGKAFDNRLGCAGAISTLRALANEDLKVDIVSGFASQEEVGARGAIVTTRVIKPDLAICFEGCPADDTFLGTYEMQTVLKKGPMLRHIDARMITNPRYQRFTLDLAKRKGVQVQEAVRSMGSTNGGSIHISNSGIPTIVIGVPVRYAHTHYGISSYFDYENSVKLAYELLKELDADIINGF